jgi:AraC-like DNA-binding protein
MGMDYFYSLDGPLDAMPTGRQMRAANLHGFPTLVRSRGADPRALLERHNIDPHDIRDPDHYIDSKSVVELFEYCSSTFNDPLFGLQLAQLQEPDVFGCVTALCRAAPTFRDAINSFMDYIPISHSPATSLELVEDQKIAELRWYVHSDLDHNNQANYQAALLSIKLLRQLGGPNFRPSYVSLVTDAHHKHVHELERRLGCRFHTAKENAIAFPVEALDQPVGSANRLVFKLLGGYLDRVKAATRITLVERVHDFVRGSLTSGNSSIERCAQKLGMSVRTLQAKLSESELKYSEILEQQRIDLAKTYLEQQQLSLDDIAANLGYSEQSSFGRAFKRWTGLSPKLYRQNNLTSVEGAAPEAIDTE